MKQEISPAIIAAGIGGVVIIVGIVGFFIFSGRPSTNNTPIPSGPPPPAAAQIVGPGATVTPGLGAPPPASAQIVGPGSQH